VSEAPAVGDAPAVGEAPAVEASGSSRLEEARRVAGAVVDPELPELTLADLGVLREVAERAGVMVVGLTPTYAACPAFAEILRRVHAALERAGFGAVEVRTVLSPAWSSDWISPEGRRKLLAAGVSPPGRPGAPRPAPGSGVAVSLLPARRAAACPRCGSANVEAVSEWGPTPCVALYRCGDCREPFEHMKEIGAAHG